MGCNMGKKNYVYVPKEEYEELIECKLHINMLHEYITKEHEDNIRLRGCKQDATDMLTIETLSGYMENEKNFDRLKREFKESMHGFQGSDRHKTCAEYCRW